jgi:hypothetical protein
MAQVWGAGIIPHIMSNIIAHRADPFLALSLYDLPTISCTLHMILQLISELRDKRHELHMSMPLIPVLRVIRDI